MPEDLKPAPVDQPLESWKAIAAYLNRDARTVMRWEKTERLPIHRHRHLARSSVYAFPRELDAWRANRKADPLEAPPHRRRRARVLVLAATIVVGAFTAGDSRFAGVGARQAGPTDRMIAWPAEPSQAATASMSPDARYVSYIDMPTRELHVRDLQANRAWRLTRIHEDGGFLDESAISRDSRFVAFAAEDKDEAHRGLRILPLRAAAGTPARLLVEGGWIAPRQWSANNEQILVTVDREQNRTDISLVNVADGAMRVLATLDFPGPGDQVALSPDGRFVAYDVKAEPNLWQRDVYVLPVAGGPPVAVLTGPTSDSVVGWSADGRHLVIRSDRSGSRGVGLWALPVVLGRPTGDPALLKPDFRGDILNMTARDTLFYENTLRTDELLVTQVDPETGVRLGAPEFAAHDREAFSRRPRWSADGKSIMYETRRPTGPVMSIRTIATGVVREIPLNLAYVWTFDWSPPDGRWIVCRATDLQTRKGVFLIDAMTGDVQLLAPWVEKPDLTRRILVPQFSADGHSINYVIGRGGGHGAYVERDIVTGVERVMKDDVPSAGTALRRSQDGQILLGMTADTKSSTLVAYDLRTEQTRELFRVDRTNAFNLEDGVQWMPDGRAVVANVRGAVENQRELWWVPVDGRQPHKIDLGVDNLVDSAIAIHPDGRHIAFVAGHPVPSKTSVLHTEFRVLENLLQNATRAPRPPLR